jgi:hypothetical protein
MIHRQLVSQGPFQKVEIPKLLIHRPPVAAPV